MRDGDAIANRQAQWVGLTSFGLNEVHHSRA
jgi:hypothetical protein